MDIKHKQEDVAILGSLGYSFNCVFYNTSKGYLSLYVMKSDHFLPHREK